MLFAQSASAASCRNFVHEAQVSIGTPVILLRRYELEAADRLKGLDTRPFEYMRDEARKATSVIADPDRLKDEETLHRCRNATRPIRKICAGAAQALVDILDRHVANPKPDYDKPQYAAAITECEKLLGLKPLTSAIRGTD